MKYTLLSILFASLYFSTLAQFNRPNDLAGNGYIVLPDHSRLEGWLDFNVSHSAKIKYQPSQQSHIKRYGLKDIKGFVIDNMEFEKIEGVRVIGSLGMYQTLKHCWGEVLIKGKINVYMIHYLAHDPLRNGVFQFQNIYLEKILDEEKKILCLPFYHRLKKSRIEKEKKKLTQFINGSAEINSMISGMSRESGLSETIEIVKMYNEMK